jgi:hypothetical protein
MFGGAVGGGKTEVLMEWLKEPVIHPGYSGLFLRRTYTQLEGSPKAPIERSRKFFGPIGGEWVQRFHGWVFPNGAMVKFGHCQRELDKHNYDGHEYHRIVFDQVEQFSETQYAYLYSRLRREKGYPVPCGVRSSANPVGGSWVKRRFVSDEAIEATRGLTAYDPSPPGMIFEAPCGGLYMPSRVADNPSLNTDEYIETLRSKLGATLAAKLANGDWTAVEGAILDPDSFRYYRTRGEYLLALSADGEEFGHYDSRLATRFATVDTAGTSKQRADEEKGKNPSWSVCAVWDYIPEPDFLFLRDVARARVDWKDLPPLVRDTLNRWNVRDVAIENAHFGVPLARSLESDGFDVELINPQIPGMKTARVGDVKGAKLERAVSSGMLGMFEKAKIYLPWNTVEGAAAWMPEYEAELMTWAGKPDETADQIDVTSYGAYYANNYGCEWGGVLPIEAVGGLVR